MSGKPERADSRYFTEEYWPEHGEKVNQKRRRKYAADPEYREKALQQARDYREKKRLEREQEPPRLEVPRYRRPTVFVYQGKKDGWMRMRVDQNIAGAVSHKLKRGRKWVEVPESKLGKRRLELYTVGALGTLLDRSVQSLNHWERDGLIPRTPYRDGRQFRFYTLAMMQAVEEALGGRSKVFKVDPEMAAKIAKRWKALGVPMGYERGLQGAVENTRFPRQ